MIVVKHKHKYRKYHPAFGNTHTCVDFHTHVWFLPNTWTGLRSLVETTPVWFLPHTWKFMSSVVIPTHVWFFPNNQNDLLKLMAIFILSIWRFFLAPKHCSFTTFVFGTETCSYFFNWASCMEFTFRQYMWLFPHMFDFSNTCVVKSTFYIGTICVAFTTQVCFIAHKCGNNQTCVGKPTQAGIGFFPHMFGKTHT